jgi:N utilization substance protein B
MVAESVVGWEKERLFSTDVVLIVMGLAEVVTFPTIPVKVTINEYVELSKFFGTPKSRSFVNGLLDRLVQNLVNEGLVKKDGKGLL